AKEVIEPAAAGLDIAEYFELVLACCGDVIAGQVHDGRDEAVLAAIVPVEVRHLRINAVYSPREFNLLGKIRFLGREPRLDIETGFVAGIESDNGQTQNQEYIFFLYVFHVHSSIKMWH